MKSSTGLDENVAGALCYLFGIVSGILFYILEENSDFVRFHAMQSIIFFAALWLVGVSVSIIPFIGLFIDVLVLPLLKILGFVVWLLCMYKAYRGEWFKLPIVGDIAERFVWNR